MKTFIFRLLTSPLFLLYKLFIKIRFFVMKKYNPIILNNQYVIGIGNITLGGTGKTPIELFLLSLLHGRANIVIRGYKRKTKNDIVGFGREIIDKYSVVDIGDEPYMIAKNFPNCYFIISNDKEQALLKSDNLPYSFTIIDDAFHKFKIKQNLRICVIDAVNPFDNNYTLPWGRLRHDTSELEFADILWISKANYINLKEVYDIKNNLLKFNKKIVITNFIVDSLVNYESQKLDFLNILNKKIFAFSGIGNFKSFEINFKLIKKYNNIKFLDFGDHYRYNYNDFLKLKQISHKYDIMITTEKDFFKISNLGYINNLFYFKMKVDIIP